MRSASLLILSVAVGAALALTSAAAAAPEAPPAPDAESGEADPTEPLDEAASKVARSAVDALATDLSAALGGDGEARNRIASAASIRDTVIRQLEGFGKQLGQLGTARTLRFTSLELRTTMWFGIIPVQRGDVIVRLLGEQLKILRVVTRASDFDVFASRGLHATPETPLGAIATIGAQVFDAVAEERCDRLPLVELSDLPKGAAAQAATMQLQRLRSVILSSCRLARRYAWHRVTTAPIRLTGVIETTKGEKLGFKMDLSAGDEGQLRIDRLTRPVPKRKN